MPTMWSYSWRMIMLLKGFARKVILRLFFSSVVTHSGVSYMCLDHMRIFSFIQLARQQQKRCVIKLKAENRSSGIEKKVYFCSTKSKVRKFLMTKSAWQIMHFMSHFPFDIMWKSLKVIINMDTILCLNFFKNDDMKIVQQIANRNSSPAYLITSPQCVSPSLLFLSEKAEKETCKSH